VYFKYWQDYRIGTVLLEKCQWIYRRHPRSVVAYSAKVAHRAVPIR